MKGLVTKTDHLKIRMARNQPMRDFRIIIKIIFMLLAIKYVKVLAFLIVKNRVIEF